MAKDTNTVSIMGTNTEYNGQLKFSDKITLDCRFTGTITSDGKLTVGAHAVIEGIIRVGEIVVCGKIKGDIIATKRVSLDATARVEGTVTTPSLTMDEGAILQGELIMDKEMIKQRQLAAPTANLPNHTNPTALHMDSAAVKQ